MPVTDILQALRAWLASPPLAAGDVVVPGVSPLFDALFAFGLGGLIAVTFAEKFVPLLPSYLMLVFIGMVSVEQPGDLTLVILATTAGSALGALGWYGLGRAVGSERSRRLVVRYGRWVLLSPPLYDRMTGLYRRNHFWVTLIGQTIPTVRIYLALPAGVIGLSVWPFLAATVLGTLIWNAPMIALGYLLRGTGYDPFAIAAALIAAILVIEGMCFLAVRMLRSRRRSRAEPAGPPGRTSA